MTKTAQTDAAVTRFLAGWRKTEDAWLLIPGGRAPDTGPPTVSFGEAWWATMSKMERAVFGDFEDFGCAVSVRIANQ